MGIHFDWCEPGNLWVVAIMTVYPQFILKISSEEKMS